MSQGEAYLVGDAKYMVKEGRSVRMPCNIDTLNRSQVCV